MKITKLITFLTLSVLLSTLVFAQVTISPSNPSDNDNIICSIPGANPAAYTFKWLVDGQLSGNFLSNTISNSATIPLQKWTCRIYANIPGSSILIGESSVSIPAAPPVVILDTTAPVISNINHSGITNISAVINWTTNELSNSSITYGSVSTNAAFVLSHSITLPSLQSNTTYSYSIKSCDAAENCATSATSSFKTKANTIVISNIAPHANASINIIVSRGNPVKFNDLSFDVDGTITSWLWRFGDNLNSTSQNPTHVYSTSGIFNISLKVTDDDGANNFYSTSIDVREPNFHGTVRDTNTGLPIAGANISFYSNSTCSLNELTLIESGDCSLNPKYVPDVVSDLNGNYSLYLPNGIYQMVIQHSKQVDKNIFHNNSNQGHNSELVENQSKNMNFEGHILYGGKYRDGNKYVIGDNLTFVMFGVNHESTAQTVSFLIEKHTAPGDGANGPWIYNGSFSKISETLTVPAGGSKVNKIFGVMLDSRFSEAGRYDVHVMVNDSGLEKWHKIGNFFIMENVTNATRLPPELRLVQGPNFYDFASGDVTRAQYVNKTFNVTFKVQIKPQPSTIASIIFSATALVDNPCIFGAEGDEVIIVAPNALVNVSTFSRNNELKFNVTNARDSSGCYIKSFYSYLPSDHFKINISLKERYYGAVSPLKRVNVTIWATEQQARDIYYDIVENSLVRPSGKAVNFTGFYAGERNPGVGAGGYGAFNQFNVTRSHSTPSYYNLQTDLFDTTWGFEYRSEEDGYDAGSFSYPFGSPAPCQNEPEVNGLGATNCERDALTARWQGIITPQYIFVSDPKTKTDLANSIKVFGDYMVANGQNP